MVISPVKKEEERFWKQRRMRNRDERLIRQAVSPGYLRRPYLWPFTSISGVNCQLKLPDFNAEMPDVIRDADSKSLLYVSRNKLQEGISIQKSCERFLKDVRVTANLEMKLTHASHNYV